MSEILKDKLKDAIVQVVTDKKGVSFAEIERLYERLGYDYKGDCSLCVHDNECLLLWLNWTQEACDIINELVMTEKVHLDAAHPLIYMLDGIIPQLPIAKRVNYKYKTPHWVPVVLNAGSREQHEMLFK